MATRRPLVIVAGAVKELPSGDAVPGAAPAGGSTGQVLEKVSDSDHDMAWVNKQITVSSTAPLSPVVNQLWLDIS